MDGSEGLEEVARLVRAAAPIEGVRLVGVDGHAGAGKSTFARVLAERLGAPLIEIDDFVSWQEYDAWWPRFEAQVLRPLQRGEDARFQRRDWTGDEFGAGLGAWRLVPWAPVVVIEGITSTRAVARDAYVVRVWVDTPEDERLRRGIARDGEDHRALWLDSIERERAIFERDAVRAHAHLVVEGTGSAS